MFNIGDNISHPMHGAGVIVDIVDRQVNNRPQSFYLVDMIYGAMTVQIPCHLCDSLGVRHIITADQANAVIASIPELEIYNIDNWSKRYRENVERIKSGDLYQVAVVVKSLVLRDKIKTLSTGERKLLGMAKGILVSELSLASGCSMRDAEQKIMDNIL
ncbi:MAG: CarD family transcriptional regulator [Clostridia bacterium]|nr:CarD family transcriptional regulator [Clostridia bacterium]